MARLLLLNKPFGMLSQFTSRDGDPVLKDLLCQDKFRKFYPAGRLDKDSEGLLLLTDDGAMQHRISAPGGKLWKHYWVQVEGVPSEEQLGALARGPDLPDGPTRPARVALIPPPELWARTPPVRFRKHIPTSWLEVQIREGRNRQVRRMTAAVGLPTLRLVRHQIGPWTLGDLQPGQYRESVAHLPRRG